MFYVLEQVVPEGYEVNRLVVHLDLLAVKRVNGPPLDFNVIVACQHFPALCSDELEVIVLHQVGLQLDIKIGVFLRQHQGTVVDTLDDILIESGQVSTPEELLCLREVPYAVVCLPSLPRS